MKRIASIDIFRALTMLLMLWVNDFAGMTGIPHWLCHAAADEDMMGFSDLVFPAFLFCVGLSLPYAIEGRLKKGQSIPDIILHIFLRTLALVVMGLFSMNSGGIEGGLSGQWFKILMVIGFFLVWNEKSPTVWMRVAGVALLSGLVAYRYAFGHPIRVGWWGILGLIGWAYLASSLVYLIVRKSFAWSVVALAVFLALMTTFFAGVSKLGFYPGGWTHVALVYSGVVVAQMMKRRNFILSSIVCGALAFLLGFLCHQVWIISKIQATPTWYFYCIAAFLPVLAVVYWLSDRNGWTAWARPVKAAGTATLTCYTIPYFWYSVQQLLGLHYPPALCSGGAGLLRSFVYAMVIILLTELLGKVNVKLKV